MIGKYIRTGSACAVAAVVLASATAMAADNLVLSRDGFFYVGGKPTMVDGREYISGQMYVEVRIPAQKTKPYPIIMVHGGTMSGTNFTGTPDGREGWAQYFVRQGYAVYVVDQPGRGRSGYLAGAYGPSRNVVRSNSASRFVSQEKSKLWPQAHLHTPVARQRRARRRCLDAACLRPAAGDRKLRQAAGPQPRCAGGAAWRRSVRRFCSSTARPAPSAGRSPMRGPTSSRRSSPSSRTARRSMAWNSSVRPIGSRKGRWR